MTNTITRRAIWNGKILAESNDLVNVEGNYYFPEESLNKEYFSDSNYHTECFWKGTASYYNVEVDGITNENAAWFYPIASEAAKPIEGRVAFWKGVQIEP